MKFARFIFIAALFVFALGASAQEATQESTPETTSMGTSLSYDVPVSGTIDDSNPTQIWPLETASADRIRVLVERTDGNLIPDVNILDTNGQPLSQSYGPDRTGAVAVIDNFTLPAGGSFQIQVGRYGGETATTTGDYTLTVIPLATAEDNPNNIVPLGEVTVGTPLQGEITNTQWINRYTFNTSASDVLRITAERVSGTLFPEVELLDSNGAPIRTGYMDETGEKAILDVALTNPGQFTVVVRRARGFTGETTGVYQLTVDLLGAGIGSPVLQAAPQPIQYDTPVTGSLVDGRWYEDWQLTAQAGDTISVTIERGDAGNLIPDVILLGGSGQELRRAYTDGTGARATLDRYQLEVPGTYTIRATRERDINGFTEGAYTLTVTLKGAGDGTPALNEVVGTVENGTAVEGELTDTQWANVWTYTAQAEEVSDIVVNRTEGTLIPRIMIQDVNGQNLREAYPEDTGDVAVNIELWCFGSMGRMAIPAGRTV
jgi:hypothetical protein